MDDCRQWPYFVVDMLIRQDGTGPATLGLDAVGIVYEVWDRVNVCHAVRDNLPDAINEAMRLSREEMEQSATELPEMFNDFAQRQKNLGADFEAAIFSDVENLYEGSDG